MRRPIQFVLAGRHPLLLAVRNHLILSGFELTLEANIDPSRPVFAIFGAEAHTVKEVEGIHTDLRMARNPWPTILLSSSSVYGDRDYTLGLRPISTCDEAQGHVITSPLDPGAIRPLTALTAEYLFAQREKTNTVVIRPFNVYGPEIAHGVIPKFLAAGLAGEPLQVHSPGRQLRTYLYLEDFLRAFDSLLVRLLNGGRGIYNVGSDETVELLSLAKSVGHALNKEVEIQLVANTERHAWWKLPALDRVKADMRWRPTYTLRSGLFRMAGR